MGRREDILDILGPDGLARTDALAHRGDVLGRHVSSAKVRELIMGCKAPRRHRRATIAHLDSTVLRDRLPTVDSYLLGRAMGALPDDIPQAHLATLLDALRDLDKLPFVSIGGQPVQ